MGNSNTYTNQRIHIIFSNDSTKNDLDTLMSSNAILDSICDYFDKNVFDNGDVEILKLDDTDLTLNATITCNIHWEGSYYRQTLESPAEYPEPFLDDDDAIPTKTNTWADKQKTISEISKLLNDFGLALRIENIYGDEVDYNKAFENIYN